LHWRRSDTAAQKPARAPAGGGAAAAGDAATARPARAPPESPGRTARRETRGAGGASTTAEGNGGDAGDSPPQRRRREEARAARGEIAATATPDADTISSLREQAAFTAIEVTALRAHLARALAALASQGISVPSEVPGDEPLRQLAFE
jgi:hypothetical protein